MFSQEALGEQILLTIDEISVIKAFLCLSRNTGIQTKARPHFTN
jgi:hypothetical protein